MTSRCCFDYAKCCRSTTMQQCPVQCPQQCPTLEFDECCNLVRRNRSCSDCYTPRDGKFCMDPIIRRKPPPLATSRPIGKIISPTPRVPSMMTERPCRTACNTPAKKRVSVNNVEKTKCAPAAAPSSAKCLNPARRNSRGSVAPTCGGCGTRPPCKCAGVNCHKKLSVSTAPSTARVAKGRPKCPAENATNSYSQLSMRGSCGNVCHSVSRTSQTAFAGGVKMRPPARGEAMRPLTPSQCQDVRNRMAVIDEESEDCDKCSEDTSSRCTKNDTDKIKDSCVDFLSIVHDTVMETVTKSVETIMNEHMNQTKDKIDSLGAQMMRSECLLSKMYLDLIDKMSQQNEKNLRQFKLLTHLILESQHPATEDTDTHNNPCGSVGGSNKFALLSEAEQQEIRNCADGVSVQLVDAEAAEREMQCGPRGSECCPRSPETCNDTPRTPKIRVCISTGNSCNSATSRCPSQQPVNDTAGRLANFDESPLSCSVCEKYNRCSDAEKRRTCFCSSDDNDDGDGDDEICSSEWEEQLESCRCYKVENYDTAKQSSTPPQ